MGRPRLFDPEVALRRARQVFWAKGYAAASLSELLAAMGIGSESLYHGFGDKLALYHQALQLYARERLQAQRSLLDHPSPARAVRDWLRGSLIPDPDHPELGCMLLNAVAERGSGDAEVRRLQAEVDATVTDAITARLDEGQATGRFDADMDPDATARTLLALLHGLQLSARAGSRPSELAAIAEAAWPDLTARRA